MNLEAFKEIYDQYFKLSRKIAADILHDYDLAGDVAQDVFMEMFLKKESLDSDKIKYWIVLNTNRRAIDLSRKPYRKHEQAISDSAGDLSRESFEVSGNPEDYLIRQEEFGIRKSALEQLHDYNDMWYDILVRFHVENESYTSLAEEYGMRVETLRVQIYRARRWLDKKVYELYESDYLSGHAKV